MVLWMKQRGSGPYGTQEDDIVRSSTDLVAAILRKISGQPNGCVLWHGTKNRGYGHIKVASRRTPSGVQSITRRVHRVVWELFVSDVPNDRCLDHLCRNKSCVNPAHLEIVTVEDNTRRATVSTHCSKGHEFTAENTETVVSANDPNTPMRRCRTCSRERVAIVDRRSTRRKKRL